MGGKVLELESDRLIQKGLEQGPRSYAGFGTRLRTRAGTRYKE